MLNGYVTRYEPDHPCALSGTGYSGFVYLHVLVAEASLGRHLRHDEVVHHLDGDRANNVVSNLLVLLHGQHTRLHAWLDRGAPYRGRYEKKRVNSGNSKGSGCCKQCGAVLDKPSSTFCSKVCSGRFNTPRKVERPTKAELRARLARGESFLAIGRVYGVSDNAVRKWARSYKIL